MLVLGIDPGTSATGYGVIDVAGDRPRYRDAGVFRSTSSEPLHRRIEALCLQLEDLLTRWGPSEVAVEGLFHHRNARSALTMAHVRGAFLLTLGRGGLDVREYSPAEVKKAVTGHGRAPKEQVREMVRLLLGLRTIRAPLDASDALALALCHAQVRRFSSRIRIRSA